jgi:PIN domain nuclease of toxin-antitoxin system
VSGLLLDTNVILFSVLESERLDAGVRHELDSNPCFVSPISAVEVAIKHGGGRLSLPPPFQSDFSSAFSAVIDALSADLIGLEMEDIGRLSRLPPIHRDPFDRILIAQALGRGLTVVTTDRMFRQYAGLKVLEIP